MLNMSRFTPDEVRELRRRQEARMAAHYYDIEPVSANRPKRNRTKRRQPTADQATAQAFARLDAALRTSPPTAAQLRSAVLNAFQF